MPHGLPNTIPRALRPRDARPSWHARLTSPWRCLPNLLVVGAQKAGTTSLHAHLDRHPEIWMTPYKECNFFTAGPRSGLAYRAFFPRRALCRSRGITVVGESTPYYLFHPAVPRRAAALLSPVRAIAVLRDPVERAWSHYRHNVRLGIEPLSIEAALDAEAARTRGELDRVARARQARSDMLRHYSYAARGRYAEQLARWFGAIGREHVLVLFFERLFRDPGEPMKRIAEFLDIRDAFEGSLPLRNRNADGTAMPASIRSRLQDVFDGPNRALGDLLDEAPPW